MAAKCSDTFRKGSTNPGATQPTIWDITTFGCLHKQRSRLSIFFNLKRDKYWWLPDLAIEHRGLHVTFEFQINKEQFS